MAHDDEILQRMMANNRAWKAAVDRDDPGFFGRMRRLPLISITETESADKSSTALDTSWLIAAAFCSDNFAPAFSFTMTLAFAG